MRILHHAINGTGLGHLHRQTNVAIACRETIGSTSVIFTNAQFLAYPRRWRIPTIGCPVTWDQRLIGGDLVESAISPDAAGEMFAAAAAVLEPDVVMFDTYYSPALLRAARKSAPGAVTVAVVRQDTAAFEDLQANLGSLLDHAFLCHTPGDVALPPLLERSPNLTWVGPVSRPGPVEAGELEEMRARLKLEPDERMLVISTGGGGYQSAARTMVRAAIEAGERLRRRGEIERIVVLPGPYLDAATVESGAGVEWLAPETDVSILLRLAAITITHGGYNSVLEAAAAGVRTIVTPSERAFEKQADNLPAFLRNHPAFAVADDPGPDGLEALLRGILRVEQPAPLPATGGLAIAQALAALAPRRSESRAIGSGVSLVHSWSARGPFGKRSTFRLEGAFRVENIGLALEQVAAATDDDVVIVAISRNLLPELRQTLLVTRHAFRRVILIVADAAPEDIVGLQHLQNDGAVFERGFLVDYCERKRGPMRTLFGAPSP